MCIRDSLIVVLEDAVTVTEPAVGRRDALNLATLPVERLHVGTDAGQLDPVGTDVLYRGRPDRPGNECQVLQPVPALLQGCLLYTSPGATVGDNAGVIQYLTG